MLTSRGVRAAFLMLSLSSFAYADSKSSTTESSAIQGITREPEGSPLPQAEVAVHGLDGNADRTVVSGRDGAFLVEDLKPGHYQLTAQKQGFASSPATTVELAAGRSVHQDITLGASDPAVPASAAVQPSQAVTQGNFFRRLGNAYLQDWKGTAPSGPEPPHRGFPAPETNPPYPFSDWPYGGSPDIGAAWTQSGPLMQAIWAGPGGDWWKKSGVQIYGWFDNGFNVSTSNRPGYANLPAAYDERPNTIIPDQEVLYIERQPDTVQTDHFDWGFRFTNLYGIDYRFTTAKGVFSQQLLYNNQEYGYDPVMMYVDLYWGQVAQGLNIRVGRYISLPDIEAQLAPNN